MEVDSDSDDEIIEQLFKKGLMQTRKRNTLKSKAVLGKYLRFFHAIP